MRIFTLFILLLLIFLSNVYATARPTYIRVGLVERFGSRSYININNQSIFLGNEPIHSATGFVVRPYSASQISLYDGSQRIRVFDSHTQISSSDFMQLEGAGYRGAIEFAQLGTGITAINVLSIEEYLFSVVPSEMPASWHSEALKAQAVAARTFALRALQQSANTSHIGFHLCDTTCCQVYRGVSLEHVNSTNAVLATTALALYHNGQLIEAVYFASSGGVTENSENVWREARPYLRSVADRHEFEAVTWQRTFTLDEITRLLIQNGHSHIGTATGMTITNTLSSGRVGRLTIEATSGQLNLEREEIRTFFAHHFEGSLQSRNFVISSNVQQNPQQNVPAQTISVYDGNNIFTVQRNELYIIDAQGNISQLLCETQYYVPQSIMSHIILTGRGFGHGVGMSQRGAQGMAIQGYDFRQILQHFYTNIIIK